MSERAKRDSFLTIRTETWTKILVGWAAAAIIAGAGWLLHIRDGLSERPTSARVDQKIEALSTEQQGTLNKQAAQIYAMDREVRTLEINAAAYVEIHRAQNTALSDQNERLEKIQEDITKILRRTTN